MANQNIALSSDISDLCKDFIKKLLAKDYSKRITVAEALDHPWMASITDLNKHHLSEAVLNIKRFSARKKLKGKIMHSVEQLGLGIEEVENRVEGRNWKSEANQLIFNPFPHQ